LKKIKLMSYYMFQLINGHERARVTGDDGKDEGCRQGNIMVTMARMKAAGKGTLWARGGGGAAAAAGKKGEKGCCWSL
jgi:hypothetical protein